MPVKRRPGGPKAHGPQVTPEAIALYERGRQLQRRKWSKETERELTDVSFQLASALKLAPFNECPLDVDTEEPPAWVRSDFEVADWHRSREIRYQLESALRARRDAAREARRAVPPSPPPEQAPPGP